MSACCLTDWAKSDTNGASSQDKSDGTSVGVEEWTAGHPA
jgi:hypothetical protein